MRLQPRVRGCRQCSAKGSGAGRDRVSAREEGIIHLKSHTIPVRPKYPRYSDSHASES